MPPSGQKDSASAAAARGFTLLLTNTTKLAGLGIAIHEALGPVKSASVLALAAFMMAGAQGAEQVIVAILDRLLKPSQ